MDIFRVLHTVLLTASLRRPGFVQQRFRLLQESEPLLTKRA